MTLKLKAISWITRSLPCTLPTGARAFASLILLCAKESSLLRLAQRRTDLLVNAPRVCCRRVDPNIVSWNRVVLLHGCCLCQLPLSAILLLLAFAAQASSPADLHLFPKEAASRWKACDARVSGSVMLLSRWTQRRAKNVQIVAMFV